MCISDEDLVVLARRLKRIESIELKLKRFKTMRLSALQDIAGVRAVLKNEDSLERVFSKLRGQSTRNKLKKVDNYFNEPKGDGYRGIHLVYQNAYSKKIEIQLRTDLQHIWATAVEIYGSLLGYSFKTGGGESEWKKFFLLLSSYFAIQENAQPCQEHRKLSNKKILAQLKKIISKLSVIERLNASTNGIQVTVSRYNELGKKGKYALLELDIIKKRTSVKIFNKKDLKKAIQIYTEKELEIKKRKGVQIVFVNIEDLEKIQKSFPNYFLDTRRLLEILSRIVLGI